MTTSAAKANRRADIVERLEAENGRLRAALTECAAEYRSPPTTIMGAAAHVGREFKRRMEIAANALEQSTTEKT